jgi:Schlafen, AlbA_2
MGNDTCPNTARAEDYLLERKTKGDLKDLLKTLVAFANSVRPGHVATILIGERDDGTPEGLTAAEVDEIQKRIRRSAEQIYPSIIWRSMAYESAGKLCIRVEIEPSGDTPHFGGPAWVRRGSETVKASDAEFQRLIDIRSSMVRELVRWCGKKITLESLTRFGNGHVSCQTTEVELIVINQFYISVKLANHASSFPLKDLSISWDDQRSQLKLILQREAVRQQH